MVARGCLVSWRIARTRVNGYLCITRWVADGSGIGRNQSLDLGIAVDAVLMLY
jgi:hypothetical protein